MATAIDGLIPAGARAPAFSLPRFDAGEIAVPDAGAKGRTLVVFYKNTCPTCQLAMPIIQRLHEQVSAAGGRVVAVSQDGMEGAASFAKEMGLTMPVAVDGPGWPVSRQYDLYAVPTLYLLEKDGTIVRSLAGFHKENLGLMAGELAASVGAAQPSLYKATEALPDFKPG